MPVDSKTFAATTWGKIHACGHCGFAFVHSRPAPADTAKFYELEAYYTQGQSHLAGGAAPSFQSRLRQHLAWRLDRGRTVAQVIAQQVRQRPARVCDIGCGAGLIAGELVAQGFQVVGVERDPKAVAFATAGFTVLPGSIEALPQALVPGSFDVVLMSHVLEHFADPVAALGSAAGLLAAGGVVVVAVPNNGSAPARSAGLSWEHLDIPRHINFFDAASLRTAAQRAGLAQVAVFHEGFCRYFSNEYIETEQRIHDHVVRADPAAASHSRRNSQWRSWGLLLRALFGTDNLRYDSVGMVFRAAAPAAH